jgi:hypothetical protein
VCGKFDSMMVKTADGATLYSETFGDPEHPPILLIMGAMASGVWWPDGFCRRLAEAQRYVIRYDHRDTGASTSYAPSTASYTVEDLADDAVAVLDAYRIGRAHLAGMSLGGYLAQLIALKHPGRGIFSPDHDRAGHRRAGAADQGARSDSGHGAAEHAVGPARVQGSRSGRIPIHHCVASNVTRNWTIPRIDSIETVADFIGGVLQPQSNSSRLFGWSRVSESTETPAPAREPATAAKQSGTPAKQWSV